MPASVVATCGLRSCGSWTLEPRLSGWGARASLLRDIWDLPRPWIEPMSPALAGGFFTTEPREAWLSSFLSNILTQESSLSSSSNLWKEASAEAGGWSWADGRLGVRMEVLKGHWSVTTLIFPLASLRENQGIGSGLSSQRNLGKARLIAITQVLSQP